MRVGLGQRVPPIFADAHPAECRERARTGEQPDGRTLVDGVDLADIVDVDLEPPQHTDWEPVAAPRRRKGKGSGASPPRDA